MPHIADESNNMFPDRFCLPCDNRETLSLTRIKETVENSLRELSENFSFTINNMEIREEGPLRYHADIVIDRPVQHININCSISCESPIKQTNWIEKECEKIKKYDIEDKVTKKEIENV